MFLNLKQKGIFSYLCAQPHLTLDSQKCYLFNIKIGIKTGILQQMLELHYTNKCHVQT